MAATIAPPAPPPVMRRIHERRRLGGVQRDDVLVMLGSAAASLALVWLVYTVLTFQPGWPGFFLWWYAAFLGIYWLAVRRIHGKLMGTDRLVTVIVTSLTAVTIVPLLFIIANVVQQGYSVINWHFLIDTIEFCSTLQKASCGGIGHAIIGSFEQVGIAMLISVPLSLLCAVFLNEVRGPLRRPVRIFVDAMSGVPSIVAGLFIFAVLNRGLGYGYSGFQASLALSILMLPTVTRTAEEVLRLVPDGLREGALAVGASEWRTTWNVVLPTARSGLITAVILGVARVVGETAPLILTSSGAFLTNANPFSGAQEALPHFIYQIRFFYPGTGPYQRSWGAAVVLITLVLILFTFARVVGTRGSVEARQRRAAKRTARLARAVRAEVTL